ncbi:hypothetical protein RDV89_03635 [Nocardioides zeae]|uniref:Epimerase n=1 Tax=Nocardioides imazamoxiresistens TaxID=3231893 RepID=A0ABU3PSE1_9ACTN|nr:hypothetical protein [Nocardioides zeae]MDT9592141.1 hypothetical protein [Nocardioides zeae]
MTARALVVGGTGPTGPHVVDGLRRRGFEVTILHRGTHEVPELADLEHLHADPHFEENVRDVVGDRTFEVVVATYGRLRHVAAALAGRCERFVGVSGVPLYPGYHEPGSVRPYGMAVAAAEDSVPDTIPGGPGGATSDAARFAGSIRRAELAVLDLHAGGAFAATLFRYPSIYGPRQLYPRDWSVVRRVLDGRRRIILADGGLTLVTRCAAQNAAAFLLAALDAPEAAAGEVFNVADRDQYSLRQWVELTAGFAGGELEVVALPFDLAGPGRELFPVPHTAHGLVTAEKARTLLGYVEPVTAAQALRSTVEWYLEHPPSPSTTERMIDSFDYAAEDRAVVAYHDATATLLRSQAAASSADHPYAHPTAPGAVDEKGR